MEPETYVPNVYDQRSSTVYQALSIITAPNYKGEVTVEAVLEAAAKIYIFNKGEAQ